MSTNLMFDYSVLLAYLLQRTRKKNGNMALLNIIQIKARVTSLPRVDVMYLLK